MPWSHYIQRLASRSYAEQGRSIKVRVSQGCSHGQTQDCRKKRKDQEPITTWMKSPCGPADRSRLHTVEGEHLVADFHRWKASVPASHMLWRLCVPLPYFPHTCCQGESFSGPAAMLSMPLDACSHGFAELFCDCLHGVSQHLLDMLQTWYRTDMSVCNKVPVRGMLSWLRSYSLDGTEVIMNRLGHRHQAKQGNHWGPCLTLCTSQFSTDTSITRWETSGCPEITLHKLDIFHLALLLEVPVCCKVLLELVLHTADLFLLTLRR